MTAIPAPTRAEIRAQLRRNAGKWIARFYRHELLLARSVRGMQIEAQQEFDREIVRPLLKQVGANLAGFDVRGNDVVMAAYPQLVELEREVQGIIGRGSDAVRRLTTERLDEMTRAESDWVADVAERDLGIEPLQPTIAEEQAAVDRPWLGAKTEEWFGSMLNDPASTKVKAWIQTGIQRGLTTDEIVRGLKGTKSQTGILEQPRHAVAALVRTAATHASTQTRIESFKSIGIDKWQFVATLDTRTSKQCAFHDGTVHDVGEGPMPPLHPNCRSTAVPYFGGDDKGTRASSGGQVPADMTFAEWLGDQNSVAQDKVLGKTVAEAWRSGKLTLKQTIDQNTLQPITVAELKRQDLL